MLDSGLGHFLLHIGDDAFGLAQLGYGADQRQHDAQPAVEIRDHTVVQPMRVREVKDDAERARLWAAAVAAFPPYAEYQKKIARMIPLFIAEPARSRNADTGWLSQISQARVACHDEARKEPSRD